MTSVHIVGPTLDDLMRDAIEAIRTHGHRNTPRKGKNTELVGVLLELTNPRARLSQTETRGKPFSCLGELCWYLAGNNELDFISYYIREYKDSAEGGFIFGGYGPRLFGPEQQVDTVVRLLERNPGSRRAVIQLFDSADIKEEHKDVPCTCSLQFMIREGALHMVTYMRSNDVYLGLPHDIFCFTMLQEVVARALSVEVGSYKHAVGSMHLYDRNFGAAQEFLNEGWQATDTPMPAMPNGNPWPAIRSVLAAEAVIRTGGSLELKEAADLDPYWMDFIRLLQIFRYVKYPNAEKVKELRGLVSSKVYYPFIDRKYASLATKRG